jgi:hypothetical protein
LTAAQLKHRPIEGPVFTGTRITQSTAASPRVETPLAPITRNGGEEECITIGHKGPPYKTGGPFRMSRVKYEYNLQEVDISTFKPGTYPISRTIATTAMLHTAPPSGSFSYRPGVAEFGDVTSFDSLGATGFRKAQPGAPIAGLGQALAELHDFPHLFKFGYKSFKDAAHNYLNLEFGWKPFLKDLRDFLHASTNVSKQLIALRRNNGKAVRRSAKVYSNSQSWSKTGFTPALVRAIPGATGRTNSGDAQFTLVEQVWFKGKFRYWIPEFDAPITKAHLIMQQLGLQPDASLVWDLLPYSWLADWFGNLGDVIHNLSEGPSNLVCLYGYLMGHHVETSYQSGIMDVTDYAGTTYRNISCQYTAEYKTRNFASPFGWGLRWNDFTDRQNSILAALAITKA